MTNLGPRQKGRCGELIVQYILLKYGIESAPLTTDSGVDLVAYSPNGKRPITIQVKTSSHLGPENDKWLLWQIKKECPADYIAAVDLERNMFWFIKTEEFMKIASNAAKGQKRLWWSLPGFESKVQKMKEQQFKHYEMDIAVPKAFSI